jgi:hypothetical protein
MFRPACAETTLSICAILSLPLPSLSSLSILLVFDTSDLYINPDPLRKLGQLLLPASHLPGTPHRHTFIFISLLWRRRELSLSTCNNQSYGNEFRGRPSHYVKNSKHKRVTPYESICKARLHVLPSVAISHYRAQPFPKATSHPRSECCAKYISWTTAPAVGERWNRCAMAGLEQLEIHSKVGRSLQVLDDK